ncbi:MAG: voltage-gated chloride channel family protein [Paludibacter sp.]|nr:voltage-gated chloride channel family protein [Paludibacter sp.]
MIKKWVQSFDQYFIIKYIIKWFILVLPVSIVVGSLVALFLWLLELATQIRWNNEWLLFLLPIVGIIIVATYRSVGKNSEAGNNLVMDEIHKPGGGIPFRMTPFILISTVITHLFGGSAGREGTAVQIGGSIAHFFARIFKLKNEDLRILLMTGVAAGFGAVFGTPVAGTIFALEVLAIGKIKYDALLPCFFAAVLADIVCTLYGIKHTHYIISSLVGTKGSLSLFHVDYSLLLWIALAGIVFGLASFMFSELSHRTKALFHTHIKHKLLIPFIGGLLIIGLTYVVGTTDYLGLGVITKSGIGTSIVNAFKPNGVDLMGWFWKLLFTVITLSAGFKGGEVTPLFFIGAALGNTIATITGSPVDLFAGLGFIAVFAGATNTPLACTIMGVELFGGQHVIYYAIACFIAYYFSGHTGIYTSQRVSVSKANMDTPSGNNTIKQIRESKTKESGNQISFIRSIKKLFSNE